MEIKNVDSQLIAAPMDPQVSIKLAEMAQGEGFMLYAAQLAPSCILKPHYHLQGEEIYLILKGSGSMKTGKINDQDIVWEEEFPVLEGDCFVILPQTVHQLMNKGSSPLKAIFVCPQEHLGSDRFFINPVEGATT